MYVPAPSGVLGSVAEKIHLNLLKAHAIAMDGQRLRANIYGEMGLVRRHQRSDRLNRGLRRLAEVDELGPQNDAPMRDSRDVEQIVQKPRHVVCLALDDSAGLVQRGSSPA